MSLVLLNLQSNQLIKLDSQNPLIIGRGNVDGCFDKRVSRNHGRITCTLDGKIRLLALHCNPCFFTRNGVPPVLQLNKDEEEILSEGDCLGLLPNAFWFQIKLNDEVNIKEEPRETDSRNVNSNDENIVNGMLTKNGFPTNEPNATNAFCESTDCVQNETKNNPIPGVKTEEVSNSGETSKTYGDPEFEKTRRLPLHMYEIDESVEPNKSPNKHKLKINQDTQSKRLKLTSEIKKEPSVKSENGNQMEDKPADMNTASTSKVEIVGESKPVSSPQTDAESSSEVKGVSSSVNTKEGYESEVLNPPKRSICQYEGNCYRKNPQHKLEFCHPGDADYVPYEERPACQYGTACYRRNERHRVEYNHSLPSSSSYVSPANSSLASSPLPAKRRRKKIKKQTIDFDDEYDVEDPFINDASSDEYVPSDWSAEEEEWDNSDTSQEGKR